MPKWRKQDADFMQKYDFPLKNDKEKCILPLKNDKVECDLPLKNDKKKV